MLAIANRMTIPLLREDGVAAVGTEQRPHIHAGHRVEGVGDMKQAPYYRRTDSRGKLARFADVFRCIVMVATNATSGRSAGASALNESLSETLSSQPERAEREVWREVGTQHQHLGGSAASPPSAPLSHSFDRLGLVALSPQHGPQHTAAMLH